MASNPSRSEASAIPQPPSSHLFSIKVDEEELKEAEKSQKETKIEPSTARKAGVPSVQSIVTARFVTPPLTNRKRELLQWLLDQYAESANFCMQKCLEHKATSIASLYRVAYREWKVGFNLAAHWFHSAGRVATQAIRSWRWHCRRCQADTSKLPVYEARTMRLDLWDSGGICRFRGNAIQIRVCKGEHLWLPLIVTEHHELTYLRDWREHRLKPGEPTISLFGNRASVSVPFKLVVEAKPIEGVCGVDINERSVDLCILKPSQEPRFIKLNVSRLPAIRHSSQLKRKSIQEKLDAPPRRPLQKRRLKAKYWRRERNRVRQIMHVVSKQVAEIAERERVAVAFEDITGIKRSMRSRRKARNSKVLDKDMRRRLNQWPFKRLQAYVDYKVLRKGLPTLVVSRYNKSRICPVCARYNRPNGHMYRCECGFEGSRHLVASWNIAKDGARHVPADCWQMKQAAEEPVAPVKPPVEPERSPAQCSMGI